MLGLYEPSEGAVRIDGIDVRQIDPADLRRNIGYVSQDVMLFFGSVRDNIVYGAPYVDDRNVLRAAEIAGVTEFVNRHPLGFEMPVGERGEGLSGGQRQSVVMARALLLNAPTLLLDEPSNSMDNTTEALLKAHLMKLVQDKTLPFCEQVRESASGRTSSAASLRSITTTVLSGDPPTSSPKT